MTPTTTVRLNVNDAAARQTIEASVIALLREDEPAPRMTVVLEGDGLPAPVVAGLIAGLRRLRSVGGAMAVETRSPSVRDALSIHGLDRVFAFPLDPDAARSPRRLRFDPRRAAAAVLAMGFTVLGIAPARAQNDIDPAAVIARVIERNPNLTSYSGRMHVDLRLISFPYFRQHLDATTYYKRPSNYEVVFDHVPSYAKGFEKLYTDVGDPAGWEKRFVVTVAGEQNFGDRKDIALHLVQRVRGQIDHETVLVDPTQWTIDQIRYDYYNGGHITMTQHFRDAGGYQLLASQEAEIAIPHVRAVASGTYDGYRTNVALDDSVFTKKN